MDKNKIFAWAYSGKLNEIEKYLEQGGNPNLKYPPEISLLYLATSTKNPDFISLLLKHGANPDIKSSEFGFTPLHIACESNDIDSIKALIKGGANPYIKTKEGNTPIHFFSIHCSNETINSPIDKNENTFLMLAASNGISSVVEDLLYKNADYTIRNSDGETALDLAKKCGNIDCENIIRKYALKHSLFDVSNVVKSIESNESKRYNAIDIIKNSTYCQNPNDVKTSFENLYNYLNNVSDYRISLVSNFLALTMLKDNHPSNENFKILVSAGDSLKDITFSDRDKTVRGCYNKLENIIYISNADNHIISSRHLVHEYIHKVYHSIMLDNKPDASFPADKLQKAVDETMHNLDYFSYSLKDKGSKFLTEDVFDRILGSKTVYNSNEYINEELLADTAKVILYINQHPDREEKVTRIFSPMIEFFDKEIVPRVEKLILDHPERKSISLPDGIKKSIRKKSEPRTVHVSENLPSKPRERINI